MQKAFGRDNLSRFNADIQRYEHSHRKAHRGGKAGHTALPYGFSRPSRQFSVADYVKAAHGIIADIAARGKLPIITGGTGLYISSLIDNLSFEETECDYAYRDELRKLAQEKGNGFLLGMLREIDSETAENFTRTISTG